MRADVLPSLSYGDRTEQEAGEAIEREKRTVEQEVREIEQRVSRLEREMDAVLRRRRDAGQTGDAR